MFTFYNVQPPPEYNNEPTPCTSKATTAAFVPKVNFEDETKSLEGTQIVLRPPTPEEATNTYEKFLTDRKECTDGTPNDQAGGGATKDEKGEAKDESPPINFNVELRRSLTKSFRFTILTIASYGFLLLPSSGTWP